MGSEWANERMTGKAHGIKQDVYGMKQDKRSRSILSQILLYPVCFANNETM